MNLSQHIHTFGNDPALILAKPDDRVLVETLSDFAFVSFKLPYQIAFWTAISETPQPFEVAKRQASRRNFVQRFDFFAQSLCAKCLLIALRGSALGTLHAATSRRNRAHRPERVWPSASYAS